MECNYFSDSNQNTIFIQKTYGKLLLILEFMVVFSLQIEYWTPFLWSISMPCDWHGIVKVAHLATLNQVSVRQLK
jgi:hypothetical protein